MGDSEKDRYLTTVRKALQSALENDVDHKALKDVIQSTMAKYPNWQTVFSHNQKEYNSETLIAAAEDYLKQNPVDVIQVSNTLWLAACYAVIIKFLGINIYMRSHNSLSEGFDYIVHFGLQRNYADYKDWLKKWKKCERLHEVGYGERMSVDKLKKRVALVKSIVALVNSIDIKSFPIDQLRLRSDKPEYEVIRFCGVDYTVFEDYF